MVTDHEITAEKIERVVVKSNDCMICPQPASQVFNDYPLCERCYAAIMEADESCFDCGEPLAEAERGLCDRCVKGLEMG